MIAAALLSLVWGGGAAGAADGAWQTREAQDVVLHYAPEDSALARRVMTALVSGRSKVSRDLGVFPSGAIQVYLTTGDAPFNRLTGGRIPHWGVGVAFPASSTIVLKYRPGLLSDLLQTVRHELSHILLHQAVSSAPSPPRVPVWFNEGVAMWSAGEWRLASTTEVTIAVLTDSLLPFSEIDAVLTFQAPRAQLAYTQSYLAILTLIEAGGRDAVPAMLEELSAGTSFDVALFRVTGMPPRVFERAWQRYVSRQFGIQGLLLSPEAIWIYLVLVVVGVGVALRFRNRATLRRWEEEDPLDALPLRLRAQVRRQRGAPGRESPQRDAP